MANTMTLIASSTASSGAVTTFDFTSIPSTYTDLCLKLSIRGTNSDQYISLLMRFNGATSGYTTKRLSGYGTGVNSDGNSGLTYLYTGNPTANGATANVFGNVEFYIPNYAGSNQKSYSQDSVGENNSTGNAFAQLISGLSTSTSAINQITLYNEYGNFAQYSTAYLYGVNNA